MAKRRFLTEISRQQKLDIIALLETGRPNSSSQFLGTISRGLDFVWYCLPPHGRSGGILIGVNKASLEVRKMEVGDYDVKFHVRSIIDGFDWALVAVYGAAQPEHKPVFLAEFVRICGDENLPIWWGVILILFLDEMRRLMIPLMADGNLCSML